MLLTAASHHDYSRPHWRCYYLEGEIERYEAEKESEGVCLKKRKEWRNGGSLSIDNGLCFSGGVSPSLGCAVHCLGKV